MEKVEAIATNGLSYRDKDGAIKPIKTAREANALVQSGRRIFHNGREIGGVDEETGLSIPISKGDVWPDCMTQDYQQSLAPPIDWKLRANAMRKRCEAEMPHILPTD